MLKLLSEIDPAKASVASIFSAFTGQISLFVDPSALDAANVGFQHLAWLVAILAGIVSIVNGVKKWFKK